MKYDGGELTQSQIEAGLAVVRGEFKGTKVMMALEHAGVIRSVPAANMLVTAQIKSGRVQRVTRGLYRAA